jgi:AcrR family transcriptional regulator
MNQAPLQTQTRATRERLIAAARDLMIEHGVLEVSLSDITQRAGVNVALVSYHFGGREGLMVAIARADAALAMATLARLRTSDLSPPEKIRRHVRGTISTYFQRPYLNRLLQKLMREGSPTAVEQVSEFFIRPVVEARKQIIEEGVRSGDFRAVNPNLIGFAIEGACAQVFTSAASRKAVLGDGALNQTLVELYMKSTADLIVNGLLGASDSPRAAGARDRGV